jgi:4-amino-4-deoxy-L-arabinose transferase-like glycosyltransferase
MPEPRRPVLDTSAGPVFSATLALAAFTYVFGLGSLHIMTNGDELLYAHITRLTAESGRWLPLACEIPEMMDTKPPFIFWQGILSTSWASEWSLWALRWPSLVWTGLTAVLVGLIARRASGGDATAGPLAAAIYLAFLGTYRYGRPFLTNPPEVFWLFLAFAVLLLVIGCYSVLSGSEMILNFIWISIFLLLAIHLQVM